MRISIVTPTIDRSHFIEEAIASVPRLSQGEVEHIVVHDGRRAFTDALLARHPHLRILAGPGTGPTPAIAMGIAAATGDFIVYLSSDDRFCAGAFDALDKAAQARPEARIWTGGTRIFRTTPDGKEVTVRELVSPAVTSASLANLLDDLPLFTARFIHRSVYAELGNLDEQFPESSDREFLVRAALAGAIEAPLGVVLSELRQHEGSHTMHRKAGIVPPYLVEHLRLADLWLDRLDRASGSARLFRNWRAREVLRLIFYQLRASRWLEVAKTIRDAAARDPLWPLRAATSVGAWRRRRRR
jgi:glycosyltransferase involved in cell wall biosynthesis